MPRGYKKPPEETRRPIVWLDIQKPTRSRSGFNKSASRKLILSTRSHEITLSEQFADELYQVAIAELDKRQMAAGIWRLIEELLVNASDQKRTLQRMRAMVAQTIEDHTDEIKLAAIREIQAGWTDAERASRFRADARPTPWSVPETDPAVERPQRPATD